MLESLAKVAGEQRKIHSVAYGIVVDDFNSFSLGERRFFDRRYLDGFWEIGHKRVRYQALFHSIPKYPESK